MYTSFSMYFLLAETAPMGCILAKLKTSLEYYETFSKTPYMKIPIFQYVLRMYVKRNRIEIYCLVISYIHAYGL